ncbi:hypothetical protein ACFY64_40490, partial [Streptomyces collinus]|uniref:hypothetical protein n=1 Tax=Streptomyces collinus TaxID=42684 RepID=UPI0036CD6E1D
MQVFEKPDEPGRTMGAVARQEGRVRLKFIRELARLERFGGCDPQGLVQHRFVQARVQPEQVSVLRGLVPGWIIILPGTAGALAASVPIPAGDRTHVPADASRWILRPWAFAAPRRDLPSTDSPRSSVLSGR